jgi:hypothetical protein
VFFYPLWVGDMPALLKAFMEQTFRPGVAMDYGGARTFPKQLLRGKTARIVTTMGMPAFFYRGFMGAHSLKALEKILTFAGVGPVSETVLGAVESPGEAAIHRWFALMQAQALADCAQRPRIAAKILRGMLRLGLLAAAGYGFYTFAQWARYGSVQQTETPDELLDLIMPDYEVRVRHGASVESSADVAFDSICDLDFEHLPGVANALFKTRELLLHGNHAEQPMPRGLLDQLASIGWTVVPDSSSREVVLVTVTQPWESNPVFRGLAREEFARFSEPGFAKIAVSLRTIPSGDGTCEVQSETRVKTTDPASRSRFRRYWALVSPGVALIRVALLQQVKRQAESKSRDAHVEERTTAPV